MDNNDITIAVNSSRYEDEDDCLTAAANEVSALCDLDRNMSPRWGDDDRATILLDLPGNLRGRDAIALVEFEGLTSKTRARLTLNKYADPIEDAREGLEVDEARAIAKEDPSLIWIAA